MVEVKTATHPDCGKGLFAKCIFKRGEIISQFTGRIVDPESKIAKQHYGWNVDLENGTYLNVFNGKGKAKFANDANGLIKLGRNNSRIELSKGNAYLVASRTINPGEEVFVSYGKAYWNQLKHF